MVFNLLWPFTHHLLGFLRDLWSKSLYRLWTCQSLLHSNRLLRILEQFVLNLSLLLLFSYSTSMFLPTSLLAIIFFLRFLLPFLTFKNLLGLLINQWTCIHHRNLIHHLSFLSLIELLLSDFLILLLVFQKLIKVSLLVTLFCFLSLQLWSKGASLQLFEFLLFLKQPYLFFFLLSSFLNSFLDLIYIDLICFNFVHVFIRNKHIVAMSFIELLN